MSETTKASIKGDRALKAGEDDKLGFREVAKRIAVSLIDHASDNGLVVGVDGAWGSGKSSLVCLIEEELGLLPETQRPTVINFKPWLVGNREALISNLFSEFSKQLDRLELQAGDATRISVKKAKEASAALRRFTQALGKAGGTIELVGEATGLGPIKLAGKGLKAAGDWAKGKPAEPQLSQLKEKLIEALDALGHRFIVTIDDVDRLEPMEVMEVLRLARSVADFPNVIYLLCYDSEILWRSIEVGAKVKNGRSYLEKIVQLTVMVPKPEAFQLRQWFSEELHSIATPKNDGELARLKTVIDYEGGRQLATPRSVIRALDAIRFFWPPLRDAKADLADLVWLQLIKDGNPDLYRWIEDYCATAAVISLGTARVDDAERVRALAELRKHVSEHHFEDQMYRHYFAEQLAGMDVDFADDGPMFAIFQRVPEHERDEAIQHARLSSPDHYRLYFALAGPSHALTAVNYDAMWAAAEAGPDESKAELLKLHNEPITGSMGKADMLLERIKGGAHELLTPSQCENLLLGFSNGMDEAYRARPFDRFWTSSLWDRAERLLPLLLSSLQNEQRTSILKRMFEQGLALGWLTSLLRRETFAHGRHGGRTRPEQDWLITDAELDQISAAMLARYQTLTADEIFDDIDPVSLLFAWQQLGDEDGPKQLVAGATESDEGLISSLEYMTGIVESSNRGSYSVLKRESLSPFLDYDVAMQRITDLKNDSLLGDRAVKLASAFANAKEF